MVRISNVIKNEARLLIIGTNTPLTFEFISWICIGYGKLFLITEADALKARLDGIKGQWGRERLAPSLTALAHFHYPPLTKTSIALCINSLKAPLFSGLLNTFSVLEDVIMATAWQRASRQVDQIICTKRWWLGERVWWEDKGNHAKKARVCVELHTRVKLCRSVYSMCVLGTGQRAEEADGNVFFSKQERLLNPCLLERGGPEGGKEGRGIWMA